MRTIVLAALWLCTVATPALAWSDRGHEAIARAALAHLHDEPGSSATLKAIATILGVPRVTAAQMARAATWPDDVKKIERREVDGSGADCRKPEHLHGWTCAEIREAVDFLAAFPDHATWHYADVPFGADYETSGFARPNDVAATIATCVDVLEGTSARFSKRIALRYLVHLVGDVHQPLHAGDGFFDLSHPDHARLIDGTLVTHANADHVHADGGGNGLFFRSGTQLHRTWDEAVPRAIAGRVSVPQLAERLAGTPLPSADDAATPGEYRHWARVWVTESSRLAAGVAYAPSAIRFGSGTALPHFPHVRVHVTWPASADDYVANADVRATGEAQMVKAARRLAELLRRIRWE